MAKTGLQVPEKDVRKVQEIIGRAATEKKFMAALEKDARKALAPYALEKATVALIEKGLKLRAQVESLEDQLAGHFGDEVKGG